MIWPIKISYRPCSDKEITKEIKTDSKSSIFHVLIKSCEIFDIKDPNNYSIMHKKITLPLFETLVEAKLVQGSILVLAKKIEPKKVFGVAFNYKGYLDSGLVKSVGHYHSNYNFINCLLNINSNSENINFLQHDTRLPNVGILSEKFSVQDLKNLNDFTLGSLGLRGNYLVTVTYTESSAADLSEFNEFIASRHRQFDQEILPNLRSSKTKIEPKKIEKLDEFITKKPIPIFSVGPIDVNDLKFSIVPKPTMSVYSTELPDSFYDLTKEELISFQKGLQNSSKSFSGRQKDISVENNELDRGSVPLKLIFPDQLQIHVAFPSECSVASISEFILSRIIECHKNEVELLTGTPYVLLNDLHRSLSASGISGPTRMIVRCAEYTYRKDLNTKGSN